MTTDSLNEWIDSAEYLPEFMRDFHDQKDLFKTIHEVVENAKKNEFGDRHIMDLNWVQAHVYTVDFFLWFMARHGYTLQRSRKRVKFFDLHTRIKEYMERHRASFAAILMPMLNKEKS